VRQLWWVGSGATASRAQDEDEEQEMTDSVTASMGLAFQDGSPKLLTRLGAEPD